AASSSGSTQTSGRFESWTSWESAYPRAAPKSPRACTLRTPPRMAASNSARAVGLPFGRAAKGEVVDAVGSKVHDRLRDSFARGGADFVTAVAFQIKRRARRASYVRWSNPVRRGRGRG